MVKKYMPEHCQRAIDFLSEGNSMVALAAHFNVAPSTIDNWEITEPEFKESVEIGRAKGQAWLESQGRESIWKNKDFNNVYYLFTMKSQYKVRDEEPKQPAPNNGHNSGKVDEMIKAVTAENPI